MSRPVLETTRRSIDELRTRRRSLPALPGLHDFRAILHAHAEDAVHTGGTRPEMLRDAQRAGVNAILLSDHFRPPRDFMDSWRGLREGVLFIPGSEVRGFLAHPMASIMPRMDAPTPDFVAAVTAGKGLIFLSHIEERPDHPMEGLTGLEIYNRHYDAKRDMATLLMLAFKMTDPKELADLSALLQEFPAELLGAQVEYQSSYLDKWDRETATRRLTGIAANDCHHNQILLVKMVDAESVRVGTNVDKDEDMRLFSAKLRPGIRDMTRGRQPGDILGRLDFDPYHRSFLNVSTHILAPELTEPAIRQALQEGRAYVSHDWLGDATGFWLETVSAEDGSIVAGMGDESTFRTGLHLRARAPLPSRLRVVRDGEGVAETVGETIDLPLSQPGVYRVEAWLDIGGEWRPWIYSNPVYLRPAN